MSQKDKPVWLPTQCFNNPDCHCGDWCALFDVTRKQCAIWDFVQLLADRVYENVN